jgi:hypothetical protein
MYLPGSAKTLTFQDRKRLNYTPGSAKTEGDIVNLGGSIFGFVDDAIAASGTGQLDLAPSAIKWVRSASATTFSIGDEVWYDSSVGLAVAVSGALDGADYPLGIAVKAKVSGQNAVAVIPFDILDRYSVIRPICYEFDVADGDTDEHILIPAWMNRHGLILKHCFGLVTEAMVGSSEDQGIVTIEDEDDNAIATLTATDGAADDVGDIIVGSADLSAASTGDAWKTVAAGKAVQGYVSQQTSGGTPAGKIRAYLEFAPLL